MKRDILTAHLIAYLDECAAPPIACPALAEAFCAGAHAMGVRSILTATPPKAAVLALADEVAAARNFTKGMEQGLIDGARAANAAKNQLDGLVLKSRRPASGAPT